MSYSYFIRALIVTGFFLYGVNLNAQKFNVKAGINRSAYILGFYSPVSERVNKLNMGNGIGAKVGAEYSLPLMKFLDADFGLFYAQRKFKSEGIQLEEAYETTLTMQYVDIPLNLHLTFSKGNLQWHMRAGALAGVLLHLQQKSLLFPIGSSEPKNEYISNFPIGGTGNFKRVDLSSSFGTGISWKNVSLNIDYIQTIGSSVNEPENNNGSYIRWNTWYLSLGYRLGE